MRLHSIGEINEFQKVINACKKNVWMTDGKDTFYNMKSVLTQYVVCGKLLEENDLELFAEDKTDEYRLMGFLYQQSMQCEIA